MHDVNPLLEKDRRNLVAGYLAMCENYDVQLYLEGCVAPRDDMRAIRRNRVVA